MEPTRSIEATVPLCARWRQTGSRAAARPRIAPYTPRHGPPVGARAAHRLRDRRVPGRARADDHGRRPAVDPRRPGRPAGGSAWIELRKASWIINGYLLVYILAMPLAGRMTDLWGARRPFMAALVDLHRRLDAGRPRPDPRPAHRRPARPGARRRRAGPGRDRRGRPPVRRPEPAARARGHRRADVPRHGRRARSSGPPSSPRSTPRTPSRVPVSPDRGRRCLAPSWRWVFFINVPIGLVALLLGWAASAGWDTPRRPGRVDVVGRALVRRGAARRARRPDPHRHDRDRRERGRAGRGDRRPAGRGRRPDRRSAVVRGLRVRDPFLDPRLFAIRAFSAAVARLAADRLRVRDRDHRRRGLRRPRAVRRAGRAAPRPRRAGRRDGGRGPRSRASRSASCRSGS